MSYSALIGTGSYLPSQILTNHDFENIVDTTDEWIVARTGIKERHICSDDETVISMGKQAALQAIERANLDPQDIDLIIVATSTPQNFFPSTACSLQHALNIGQSIAFDVSAACSGFIYALTIADQFIRTGTVKHALVVGAETMSRAVDWQDRNTCVLFGDGAGAVVLEASDEPGIIATKLYADGKLGSILQLPSGFGFEEEACHCASHSCCCSTSQDKKIDNIVRKKCRQKSVVSMKGREVFKQAVESMVASVRNLLADANMSLDEVDWIVPHQANARIINLIAEKLNFPKEKVMVTVENQANTSGASIPLALDLGITSNDIKKGQTLLLEAFGGGVTWGSILLKY